MNPLYLAGLAIAAVGAYFLIMRSKEGEASGAGTQDGTSGAGTQDGTSGAQGTVSTVNPDGTTTTVHPGVNPPAGTHAVQGAPRTGTVIPSEGANVRTAPNENSPIVPVNDAWGGTTVTVLETGLPPTPAAPSGWLKVQTPGGSVGYVSAELIQLS